jgi:hypothetical protein
VLTRPSLKFKNVTVAMLKDLKVDSGQLLTGVAAANEKLDALVTSNMGRFTSEQIAPLLQAGEPRRLGSTNWPVTYKPAAKQSWAS